MGKTRVMVIDDSVVLRKLITEALGRNNDIEVAGTAADGRIALAKLPHLSPDLVTLDIEMPHMDGLETLKQIRAQYPLLPVIMLSTVTRRGALATFQSLEYGASDYVTKPGSSVSAMETVATLEAELVPRVLALGGRRRISTPPGSAIPQHRAPVGAEACVPRPAPAAVGAVVIGSSTGGPSALTEVLTALQPLRVPTLIVQHMPPMFTTLLAERLTSQTPIACFEARDGERPEPGRVYISPGDRHMSVVRYAGGTRIKLTADPPENSCRPAVDVLFRTAAQVWGQGVLGVVLTGMGSDGKRGAGNIREAGGSVVVQDRASSVVWGMPGAVAEAGLADAVLPLKEIAGEIRKRVAL